MLGEKLTELDTKQNPFIIARANDPFDKMFNMIRRKCTNDTRQPLCFNLLTLDMFTDLTKEFEAFLGCDIL
jgi:hypothetical protein